MAVTVTVPDGPCGELPIPTLVASAVHAIVDCVPPETSLVTVMTRSVRGVSEAEKVASCPSPHVEPALTLTLCALESFPLVMALLRLARKRLGGELTAFEVMWNEYYRLVIERVKQSGSDEEILEWCFEKGRRPNEGDLMIWNGFVSKLGWRDFATPILREAKQKLGIADRNDIRTIGDLIDFEEGRLKEPPPTKARPGTAGLPPRTERLPEKVTQPTSLCRDWIVATLSSIFGIA